MSLTKRRATGTEEYGGSVARPSNRCDASGRRRLLEFPHDANPSAAFMPTVVGRTPKERDGD